MQVEVVLLILSLLFFASIFTDKIGYKFGVPALLLFLTVGMLFGPDGIGALFNDNGQGYMIKIETAEALSTIALCIILFSGGMDTKLTDIRPVLAPGVTLATLGVLLTALVTGLIIFYAFDWMKPFQSITLSMALLIAATMSSTDSASVFSILRTNGIGLKRNLRPLLENYPNLHAEMSQYWVPEGITDMAKIYGADKLLYGSGMPKMGFGSTMLSIVNLQLPEGDIEKIASGNIKRLLAWN